MTRYRDTAGGGGQLLLVGSEARDWWDGSYWSLVRHWPSTGPAQAPHRTRRPAVCRTRHRRRNCTSQTHCELLESFGGFLFLLTSINILISKFTFISLNIKTCVANLWRAHLRVEIYTLKSWHIIEYLNKIKWWNSKQNNIKTVLIDDSFGREIDRIFFWYF